MKTMSKAGLSMVVALAAFAAQAAEWPDKPIRVILSVPAGATPDVTARLVFPGLSQQLGVSLVADNRAGGGGVIGAEIAAKSAPDGYTLFISSPGALTILPHMRKGIPYDTIRDFAPVSLISIGPFVLMTHPAVPAKTVRELIALAKSQPGKLNYASAGNGVANHLAGELFKQMAGVDIVHVPYKGAPQAVTDVLAGHMNMMFKSVAPIVGYIKTGQIRVLGIASLQRSPQLPDVPTIHESGVPGFEAVNWFGLFAPAKTPRPIINKVHGEVVKALNSPDVREKLVAMGSDPVGSTPEEFYAHIKVELERWGKVIRDNNIRSE